MEDLAACFKAVRKQARCLRVAQLASKRLRWAACGEHKATHVTRASSAAISRQLRICPECALSNLEPPRSDPRWFGSQEPAEEVKAGCRILSGLHTRSQ